MWVHSDDYGGLRQVIEHLVELGHQKIAFFNGNPESRLSKKRDGYFLSLMNAAGLPVNEAWMVHGHWSWSSPDIEVAAQKLLKANPLPTAVICVGAPFAMVMIRAAQNAGLKLPEQMSITGFADFFYPG